MAKVRFFLANRVESIDTELRSVIRCHILVDKIIGTVPPVAVLGDDEQLNISMIILCKEVDKPQ
jgi:hypothetical protein